MLSSRGEEYAKAGLMAGYKRKRNPTYDKVTNPDGEISFVNAENVCNDCPQYVWKSPDLIQFLMINDVASFINNNVSSF